MSFPDVLPPLIVHLAGVTSLPTSSRVPVPRPVEFVQVRRVAGLAEVPVRDQARVDVIVWAGSDERAMQVALDIRAAVWALAGTALGGVQVYRVAEFLGPRLDDDTTSGASGQSRQVWATYELSVRAESAVPFAPTT